MNPDTLNVVFGILITGLVMFSIWLKWHNEDREREKFSEGYTSASEWCERELRPYKKYYDIHREKENLKHALRREHV